MKVWDWVKMRYVFGKSAAVPRVKYVGHYVIDDDAEGRVAAASAINKMNYVADVLRRCGYAVSIVSASRTSLKQGFAGYRATLQSGSGLVMFRTLPWRGRLGKALSLLYGDVALFFNLAFSTKRGEIVVVYHSLGYRWSVIWAKRLRRFPLILEVEEVYQDVARLRWNVRRRELSMVRAGDAYIVSTQLLVERLGLDPSVCVTCHGSYKLNPQAKSGAPRLHAPVQVVYAGIIDSIKGGANRALETAVHLDGSYQLHILGFGAANDMHEFRERMATVKGKSDCGVSFHGALHGDEFNEFLGACDIGLSTQNPSGKFGDSSFPSKVLTYLCLGLSVVSVRIPVLELSKVRGALTFAESESPRDIALAVRAAAAANRTRGVNSDLISELDVRFENELRQIFAGISK